MGFAVAVATGVPLGFLMGRSRRAEARINPVLLIVRPIPPLAWIPLAILRLGPGDAAKILVGMIAAAVLGWALGWATTRLLAMGEARALRWNLAALPAKG